MPTTRPRHVLTETPDLAAALDAAAEEWPDIASDRAALLRRLVATGADEIRQRLDERAGVRRRALDALAGSRTGRYPEGYLDSLRAEWPE